MDPALIGFDLAQAGAIVADMIISYLAAGAPPLDCEEPNDDDVQDRRSASVETGVYLHSPVDVGAGAVQSGEHGSSVQPGQQGSLARGFALRNSLTRDLDLPDAGVMDSLAE